MYEGRFDESAARERRARQEACRILGVAEDAGREAVKKAYRRACLRHHPDSSPDGGKSHKRFLLVRCAYELLTSGTICSALLDEIESGSAAAPEGKYSRDNAWGFFMWWREQFFEEFSDRPS